jgi:hypothetical protein
MKNLIINLSKLASALDKQGKFQDADLIDEAIKIIAGKKQPVQTSQPAPAQAQATGPIQYPGATFLKEEIYPGRTRKAAWYVQETPGGKQLVIIEAGSSGAYPTRQAGPEGSIFFYPPSSYVTYGKTGWNKLPAAEGYTDITLITEPTS